MPEETINWKNQLNDKLSKIHASLQGFITETEFNRFKNETRDKLEELEKKHGKLEG
jgi:NADPH-dependent curcumin reductase CurA